MQLHGQFRLDRLVFVTFDDLGEAAAAGGVVLAASCGGLRQSVIDQTTGFLLPPGQPQDWAAAINECSRRALTVGGMRAWDAWVPLMHLFPEADLPVVQVALPVGAGPAEVYALGAALRGLRSQGVLVMGSGSMTHNLAEFFGGAREPAPYVIAFSRWIESALERGDLQALLNYRSLAPHAERAHPTEDHFLPLFFALGAAGDDLHANYLSREVMCSLLAMDAFALQPVA